MKMRNLTDKTNSPCSPFVAGTGQMKGPASLPCFLHLALSISSVFFQYCRAIDTISVTQPLQDPNFLVSSGGTYKLGFFSPENTTNRYVGIMYNVPKMAVVWVANRNKPLNESSGVLAVSKDGNLVVLNRKKEIMWSSNAPNAVPNSTAQLLYYGNLVLRDSSNGRHVWESFQNPGDTFLPGMKLGETENGTVQLTSWKSPSDPSTGSFSFGLDPQRFPELFVWNEGALFWRSGPWDGLIMIGVPRMGTEYRSRYINLVKGSAGVVYIAYDYVNTSSLWHAKLSISGIAESEVLNEKGDWEVYLSLATSECDVYGICGPNDDQEWTKGNWSAGCLRKAPLRCERNSSADEQDGYFKFTHVKVPDLFNVIVPSEEECGSECLKNCSCSAYTFVVGIGCMHWAHNLIDIQQFSKRGSDLYLRLPHSELGGMSKSEYMFRDSIEKAKLEELTFYSYETIANATEDFNTRNKLGRGGFGSVYKGKLVNGQEIAVKRLSSSSTQGMKEFMTEVTLISKLQHRNLVRLLGCCVERDEKMLVYEYLPNKSLDTYIFDSRKQDLLDWNRRLIIIEGISRGLLYLHRDSRLRIIHRDLKASNILLDEDLNPKISDFGLARTFGGKQDQDRTNRVVGTYGYMAPEYAMGGNFSEKSDVYSFGVLLLEIVSGKKNSSFYLHEESLSLLGYAWKCWNENETAKLACMKKPDLSTEMEIQRCIQVSLLCVQESADDRPNMFNVLLMINSEFGELPRPKLPAYTVRLTLFQEKYLPQHIQSFDDSLTDIEAR